MWAVPASAEKIVINGRRRNPRCTFLLLRDFILHFICITSSSGVESAMKAAGRLSHCSSEQETRQEHALYKCLENKSCGLTLV
jgi:hypothetical protein